MPKKAIAAIDELIDDYSDYNIEDGRLTFTEWVKSPVFCDQELLAEAMTEGLSLPGL